MYCHCKQKYPVSSYQTVLTGLLGTSFHGSDKTSYLAAEGCVSKVLEYLQRKKRSAPTEQPRRTGSQANGRKRGVSRFISTRPKPQAVSKGNGDPEALTLPRVAPFWLDTAVHLSHHPLLLSRKITNHHTHSLPSPSMRHPCCRINLITTALPALIVVFCRTMRTYLPSYCSLDNRCH